MGRLGVLILWLAAPAVAMAQQAPEVDEPSADHEPAEIVAADDAPAEQLDDDELRARDLFRSGSFHFDAGDYDVAAAEFEEAYQLSPQPELLYNIYLASERIGNLERAVQALDAFLQEGDPGERREAFEMRLARLRDRLDAQRAREAEAAARREEAARREQVLREAAGRRPDPGAAPWVIAGAGAAVAIAGIVLLAVSQADIDAVENPSDPAPRWADVEDAFDRAPVLSTFGAIGLGVGGAALLAGTIWGLVVATRGDPEPVDVSIGPSGLRLGGAF